MKNKIFILLLLAALAGTRVNAQLDNDNYRTDWLFGVTGGYNSSHITNLNTMIISEPFFTNYSLVTKNMKGYAAGGVLSYRNPDHDHFGFQAEFLYSAQGSALRFMNTQTNFNYWMKFGYQFVNLNFQIKVYPCPYGTILEGLNVGVGAQGGINAASNHITYTSDGSGVLPAFGTDKEQEQQLRNVLKGRDNAGFLSSIGYELPLKAFVLQVDGRYYLGMSDVVETQANSYNFVEEKNRNRYWQVSLGLYYKL